ncbi:MAG: hypothetical protein Q9196_001143 [Gyalolechia fulgens]
MPPAVTTTNAPPASSNNDPASSPERSPGRRKSTEATGVPRKKKKQRPSVASPSRESHPTDENVPPASPTAAEAPNHGTSSSSSSLSASTRPGTVRLEGFRSYLRRSDPCTDPHFRSRYREIEASVADLARSRELFDVGVYNDVRSMLRVHGERMLDEEEAEAEDGERGRVMEEDREEEEGEPAGIMEGEDEDEERGVVTYKVPSWSTMDSGRGRAVTYKVPSWSTTESGRFGIVGSRRGGEGMAARNALHHAEKEKGRDERDGLLDEELEDANPLTFAPALLRKAEMEMGPPTEELHGPSNKRGKRPFIKTIDSQYANKRAKRAGIDGPTSAEIRFIEGKPYIPLEEHEHGDTDGVEEEEEEEESEEDEEGDEDGAPPRIHRDEGEHNLIGDPPKLGSGSLIPPEIARFDFEEGKISRSHAAAEKKRGADVKEDMEMVTQFWPGDPAFMFGETKFLQAVKSRQIEKDLARSKFRRGLCTGWERS